LDYRQALSIFYMSRPNLPLFHESPIEVNGRVLLLAYDQGMEHGPVEFNETTADPNYVLKIAEEGPFTGVVFQKGLAEKYYDPHKHRVPLVLKMNGKDNLIKDQDPYSPQLCTVDEALALGAKAVGYTIYLGSQFESKMFQEFAGIVRDAHQHGMPVIAWMYPRGHNVPDEKHRDILAYAARVALELGADYAKLNYPGDVESQRWVVQSAGKCKVLTLGGSLNDMETTVQLARDCTEAGSVGMAIGRNVWQSDQPLAVARALGEVIFGGHAPEH
jgi:class I fructose-bisphosphate aldolase